MLCSFCPWLLFVLSYLFVLGMYIIIRVKHDLLFSEGQKCINICNAGFDIKHLIKILCGNDDEEEGEMEEKGR